MQPIVTDQQFAATWRQYDGEGRKVADALGMSVRGIYRRRNIVEEKLGLKLPSAGIGNGHDRGDAGESPYNYRPRLEVDNFVGTAVVFSDAHWWPGLSRTLAYKALAEVVKEVKPGLIIGNGDLLDGARVSRFGRSDWQYQPRMSDELEEVKNCCSEIRHANRRGRTIRTIGNHCQRFDKYLANRAGEFENIGGFRLADHLKEWEETVSVWINGHTVIKHRWHGGVHAAWNNVMKSGVTMVTGHTHTLLCRPFVDYRGRRYGIEDGTLAEPAGPQFSYAEDNPSQGCSGFVLLTFDKSGRILHPELCEVVDGAAYFRGQIVVSDRKKKAAA